MKPSWDEAPEWANWLAMDKDGSWVWFERKPYIMSESDRAWREEAGTFFRVSTDFYGAGAWTESLERRP